MVGLESDRKSNIFVTGHEVSMFFFNSYLVHVNINVQGWKTSHALYCLPTSAESSLTSRFLHLHFTYNLLFLPNELHSYYNEVFSQNSLVNTLNCPIKVKKKPAAQTL